MFEGGVHDRVTVVGLVIHFRSILDPGSVDEFVLQPDPLFEQTLCSGEQFSRSHVDAHRVTETNVWNRVIRSRPTVIHPAVVVAWIIAIIVSIELDGLTIASIGFIVFDIGVLVSFLSVVVNGYDNIAMTIVGKRIVKRDDHPRRSSWEGYFAFEHLFGIRHRNVLIVSSISIDVSVGQIDGPMTGGTAVVGCVELDGSDDGRFRKADLGIEIDALAYCII